MSRHLALLVTLLLSVSFAAAGCGGDSDEDKVREVVQQFIDADPDVCGKLTDKLLEEQFDGKEACEKAAREEGAEFEAEIESVEIDGDEARVRVDPKEGESATVVLVKEDGDWLISSIEEEQAAADEGDEDTATTEDPAAADRVAVQGTVDAFVTAVKEQDEEVLCGLLSPRLAAELVGGDDPNVVIAQCVEAFREADLSDLRREAERVKVEDVEVSGNTATVGVTGGETLSLEKQEGRWVIDRFGSAGG